MLSRLLPELSDLLTEAGFPWEITCVDCASSDGTSNLLGHWSELPGFRWIRLARDYGQVAAMHTGLRHATGDAVILVTAGDDPSIHLLPNMITRWDEGHDVVLLRSDGAGDVDKIVSWSLDAPEIALTEVGDEHVVGAGQSMLLDRRVVDLLFEQAASSC
jgi:glycosyltransferase involved in cell wall biosynthesis